MGRISAFVMPSRCVSYFTKCIGKWAVQIYFSVAFDRVSHQGILFKLWTMGIVGSVSSIFTQFLSNLLQYIVVDGCRSNLVNMVFGAPQNSVLGPLLLLLYTSKLFSILKKKLYSYGADSTLVAVVPYPLDKVVVAEFLNRDLNRGNE